MLDALVNVDGYRAAHGLSESGFKLVGDMDLSGAVTNADIQALLNRLTGQSGQSVREISLEVFGDEDFLEAYTASVPEPATFALLAVGGVALLRRR
jgi:hypothetical protein